MFEIKEPEKPKRYEIREKYIAAGVKVYRVFDTYCKTITVKFPAVEDAEFVCEKLNELQQYREALSEFRKLPIPLHTPAPEKPKRYEVYENPSNERYRWRVYDKIAGETGGAMIRHDAIELCEKLNRLEELEAS